MYRWCTLPARMFCPQCKSEYRQGFTRCADCDVELAEKPAENEGGFAKSRPSGNLAPLWEGENLALHTTLLEYLDSAGIRYFDRPMGVFPGVRRGDHFPIQPMTRFGYQVAVLSSDLQVARGIVERLLGEDQGNLELPESEMEAGGTAERISGKGEAATCQVWVGPAKGVGSFLDDALRENDIDIRTEHAGVETKIYVRPSDETRAREIVREIVEGAPPE